MKPITCPKCRGKLESLVYQNIEIDRCSCCAGMWFDCLEAEQLRKHQGSEMVDVGSCQGLPCDRSEKQLQCPRCHAKMMQMLDLDLYALWYEKCSKCQGIWLDAGEFKKFKQNFPKQDILKQTIQILRPQH
jgi:Zn-finger nucleic acid-binding protein